MPPTIQLSENWFILEDFSKFLILHIVHVDLLFITHLHCIIVYQSVHVIHNICNALVGAFRTQFLVLFTVHTYHFDYYISFTHPSHPYGGQRALFRLSH